MYHIVGFSFKFKDMVAQDLIFHKIHIYIYMCVCVISIYICLDVCLGVVLTNIYIYMYSITTWSPNKNY